MEEWLTEMLLNVAAGVTILAITGAAGWVTWVSRKIPSFTRNVSEMKKSLDEIVIALKAIPHVQAAMAEHEKDDAALFSDLRARMKNVEGEVFRRNGGSRESQSWPT